VRTVAPSASSRTENAPDTGRHKPHQVLGHDDPVERGLDDHQVRLAAFQYLDRLSLTQGEVLPWSALVSGFTFLGHTIPLIGAAGIWKPQVLDVPISITTSPKNPYGDTIGRDGLLSYRYQGSETRSYDNDGLRRAMREVRPLIYFHGLEKGQYSALWPAVIVGDDPTTMTFSVACEDIQVLRPDLAPTVVDDVRRRYVTKLAVQRLHQTAFRQRVLRAYRESCSVCNLHHVQLLDAAHILPDGHERGDPVVTNGLSLCKIHHAAFDANILGVRPDYVVEIRSDILTEIDGPMLKHGLQAHHGGTLLVPRSATDRPDRDRLELRYEGFRRAS
jgi:putative restriction endonuclease